MFDCTLLRPTLSPSIVCVAGQFTVTQTFWQLITQPLRGQLAFPLLISVQINTYDYIHYITIHHSVVLCNNKYIHSI